VNVKEYGILFWTGVGVLALLVASPVLSRALVFPRTEFFTEFWVLDSGHRAENYPFNISASSAYQLYLGIANYLGYSGYYLVQVKLRNQTQSASNSFNRTPSEQRSLLNITAFVADQGSLEKPLTFAFDYSYNNSLSTIEFNSLRLNDFTVDIKSHSTAWDTTRGGFFSNLLFELWLYNTATRSFQYHERFLSLWQNMTVSDEL